MVQKIGLVSIYRRGARYWLSWRQEGRSRRIAAGVHLREAVRRATEIDGQQSYGLPSLFGFEKITVAKLVARWLEYHELVARTAVGTLRHYRACARRLTEFVAASCPLVTVDQFTPRHAEEFVKYLRRTEVTRNGKPAGSRRPMSERGVINVLQIARNLVNYAMRQRHLPPYSPNPFAAVKVERMLPPGAAPMRLFRPEEETAFLEACDDWELPVFLAAAFTGMRPGELMHLMVTDVDFAEEVLNIRNRPRLGWLTKTRRERRLMLFPELARALRSSIAGRTHGVLFLTRSVARGERSAPLGHMTEPELEAELVRRVEVLRQANGGERREEEQRLAVRLWADAGAINGNEYSRAFARLAAKIGRPDMTRPHSWRHAMACAMQSANVDIFVRKELLGHANLTTTMLYTHGGDAMARAGMAQVLRLRAGALDAVRRRLSPADTRPAHVPGPPPAGLAANSEALVASAAISGARSASRVPTWPTSVPIEV